MMTRLLPSVGVATALFLGCNGGGGDTGTTPTSNTPGSGSVGVSGTLDKKPFTAQSGFAHVDRAGQLALELSSGPDYCADVTANKRPGSAQFVGLYRLATPADGGYPDDQRAAVGPVTSDDMKYAEVGACTAGAPIGDKDVVAAGRVQTAASSITITLLTSDKVEGSLDLTFDDGSHLSGSFSVPTCAAESPETSYCR